MANGQAQDPRIAAIMQILGQQGGGGLGQLPQGGQAPIAGVPGPLPGTIPGRQIPPQGEVVRRNRQNPFFGPSGLPFTGGRVSPRGDSGEGRQLIEGAAKGPIGQLLKALLSQATQQGRRKSRGLMDDPLTAQLPTARTDKSPVRAATKDEISKERRKLRKQGRLHEGTGGGGARSPDVSQLMNVIARMTQ